MFFLFFSGDDLRDFSITAVTDKGEEECASFSGSAGPVEDIYCTNKHLRANVLIISMDTTGTLTLCEVQVFWQL